jgi:hypothetical protein
MFGVLILLGLAVDIKSRTRENASDANSIIAFFLVFFGNIIVIIE